MMGKAQAHGKKKTPKENFGNIFRIYAKQNS